MPHSEAPARKISVTQAAILGRAERLAGNVRTANPFPPESTQWSAFDAGWSRSPDAPLSEARDTGKPVTKPARQQCAEGTVN